MKITKWIALFLLPVGLAAFAPQPYHTAEVNSGELSFTPSMAGEYFSVCFFDCTEGFIMNPQLSFRYTFPNTEKLALFAYGGALFSSGGPEVADFVIDDFEVSVFPNGGFGVQLEIAEQCNFSAALSAEFPSILCLTLMKGIRSRKLDREVLTLGIKSLFYIPSMLFVTAHPTSRLHLSLGASYLLLGGEVHAGIGYTFNLAKQEKEEGNETIEE